MRIDNDSLKTACFSLARRECTNYQDGMCILNDQPCRSQLFSPEYEIRDGGIDCDWFWEAVLPQDPDLKGVIFQAMDEVAAMWGLGIPPECTPDAKTRTCKDCGKLYTPTSNNQIRCRECGAEIRKKRNAGSHRQRYWQAK